MTYVLIAYIYAGLFAKGDSVSIESVDGFATREKCESAGEAMKHFVAGTAKELKFICVEK